MHSKREIITFLVSFKHFKYDNNDNFFYIKLLVWPENYFFHFIYYSSTKLKGKEKKKIRVLKILIIVYLDPN